MKSLIFVALISFFVLSASAADNAHICSLAGSIYETAVMARDMRVAPERALEMTSPYEEIPRSARKKIINQVYFDKDFANVDGAPLRVQMMNLCINGPSQFQPLK